MNIRLLLFVFLISTISIMTAQNHMNIMTTMTGEHSFAEIGWLMTTLDWNGDLYDDLVVVENQWNPNGFTPSPPPYPYGKLLVYYEVLISITYQRWKYPDIMKSNMAIPLPCVMREI